MVAFRAASTATKIATPKTTLSAAQQLENLRFKQGLAKESYVIQGNRIRAVKSNRGGRLTKAARKQSKEKLKENTEAFEGKTPAQIDGIKAANTMTGIMTMTKQFVNDPNIRAKIEQMDSLKVHQLLKGENNALAEMVFNYHPTLGDDGWANQQMQELIDQYEAAFGTIEVPMSNTYDQMDLETFGAFSGGHK